MFFSYLKIASFLCLLQLTLAADGCEPFHFLSSRDYDTHLLQLNCFPPANFSLECVQKILDERNVRNKIEGIFIDECEGLNTINGSDILKALDLKFVDDVEFKQKDYNERIERNVSVEHGAYKLELDFSHGEAQIDVDLFRSYENIRELELEIVAKEVPDEIISNLKRLKKLKYHNRRGGAFEHETLMQLPQLEYLNMYLSCFIRECEDLLTFKNMVSLKELELTLFHNFTIRANIFEGTYNLEALSINHYPDMKKLPDNLFKDQINLEKLDLRANELEIVQSELFTNLKKLKYLDLSNNKIGDINWEWPLLPSLETLFLSGNDPPFESAGNIRIKLRSSAFKMVLHFSYMHPNIEITEAVVCKTYKVCEFAEGRNGKKCPKDCKCRYEVATNEFLIDCAQRNLTEIPELPIPNIGNVTLRVSHNHIKQLPNNSLYGYSNIAKLYAGSNEITSVGLEQIPANIRLIDLNNNPLADVNDDVVGFLNRRKDIQWSWIAKNKCTLSTYLKNTF